MYFAGLSLSLPVFFFCNSQAIELEGLDIQI